MVTLSHLPLDVLSHIMSFVSPMPRIATIDTLNRIDDISETSLPISLFKGFLHQIQWRVKEIDLVSISGSVQRHQKFVNKVPENLPHNLDEKGCQITAFLCTAIGKELKSLKLPAYICPEGTCNILYQARNCTSLENVALHQDLFRIEENVGNFLSRLPSLRTLEISVMDINILNSLASGNCRIENMVIHTLNADAVNSFAGFLFAKGHHLQTLVIKAIAERITYRNIDEENSLYIPAKLQRMVAKSLAFDVRSVLQNLKYIEIPVTSQEEPILENPDEFLVFAFKGQAEVCIRKDTIGSVFLYDKESNVHVKEFSIDPYILNMVLRNPDLLVDAHTLNLSDSSIAESYIHCSHTRQAVDLVLDQSCHALENINCRFTPPPETDAKTTMAFLGLVLNKCTNNVNITCSYTLLKTMFGVRHEGQVAELFNYTVAAMGKIKSLGLYRGVECPAIDGCEPCARIDIEFLATLPTFLSFVSLSLPEMKQISFSLNPFCVAKDLEYVYLALRRAVKEVEAFAVQNPGVDVSSMRYELHVWLRRHEERMSVVS